jgi:phage-related protein
MKNWHITYFNEKVKNQILDLPDSLVAKYINLVKLILTYGPNLGMPHTKAIGEGLFELRLKGKEGIARVFYCVVVNKEVVMLHSFVKKTDKLPLKELEVARNRLKEVLNEKN